MSWNVAAECVSIIFLCIIWMYSRQGYSLPTLKNKVYQVCFGVTFLAMTSNVLSTCFIQYEGMVPQWLNMFVTTVYFIATPLMGVVYFTYLLATLYENQSHMPKLLFLLYVPAIVYMLAVIANLWNHCLFWIQSGGAYIRGPLIGSTYVVFYIYCLLCVVMVGFAGRYVDLAIRRILVVFPLMATVVVIFQQFFPAVILSGSAATCATLIIYLNIQNKQLTLDYLLKIPNRQEFLKTLQLHLRKKKDEPFYIGVISLRNFKQVNDTYGQNSGDEYLKTVSNYISTVMKPWPLYRFSGDEFAVIMDGDSREKVRERINLVMEQMERPWEVEDYSCMIGAVAGVVGYPDSASDMENLINAIEYAVSYAKSGKEGNICYCRPEMLEQAKRRLKIIEILKDAVLHDGFDVYYQPMWSVKEKRFTMCESLLRLNNTPLGPLYPGEFIPLAEETGMIIEITYLVLDKVCRFIKQLLELQVELESITVNFSAVQFVEMDIEEKIFRIIDKNQIPYEKIKIEITESLLADSPETVERFIDNMHQKEIQIGMDDFGTGYCNLASVMNLPMDVVKIDKSLLWSAMKNEKSAIMMRSIVAVVHELGMRVVSEGVETEEQRVFVEECGCEWIQGFLYAKPMPEAAALETLTR